MVDSASIGIQGIEGSYHHEAVVSHVGGDVSLATFATFEHLIAALSEGRVSRALMAIENSIAGSILPNYMLLAGHPVRITGEVLHPVDHCLLALPGQTPDDLREVHSHPMALAQCKAYFEAYPGIRLVEAEDTAGAARWVREKGLRGVGAIAGRMAARIHGLESLADSIQTITPNLTRFVVLERGRAETAQSKTGTRGADGDPAHAGTRGAGGVHSPATTHAGTHLTHAGFTTHSGPDKASLRFTLPHEKGSLVAALSVLQQHSLNLTKIQSLPLMETPGRYAFFVDVLFERRDGFEAALEALRFATLELTLLGLYPGAHHPEWS